MRISVLVLVCACAVPPPTRVSAPGPAAAPADAPGPPSDKPRNGIPPSGEIKLVAVDDAADAAFSADELGGLQLWPALDGSRPPVAIPGAIPRALALGADGDELVAALLDASGGVEILELSRTGAVHRHTILASEPAGRAVVAIGAQIAVLRADHTIELYDRTGVARGRIVADGGEQITALAARHGHAAALVTTGKLERVRWLRAGATLAWDATVTLRDRIAPGKLALSPSGTRFAVATKAQPEVVVYDAGGALVLGTNLAGINSIALGFVDDDHALALGSTAVWWQAAGATRAIADARWPQLLGAFGAAGDGRYVAAVHGQLVVATPTTVQFLGYDTLGAHPIYRAGSQLAFYASADHWAWLDDRLAEHRTADVAALGMPGIRSAVPVGEHHLVVTRDVDHGVEVDLVDVADRARQVVLGSYGPIEEAELADGAVFLVRPEAHVGPRHELSRIERYQLDLAHTRVSKLAPIDVPGTTAHMRVLDPAKANGAAFVAWGRTAPDPTTVVTYYADDGRPIAGDTLEVAPSTVGPDGTLYRFTRGGDAIIARRHQHDVATFAVRALELEASPDGAHLEVRLDDDHGNALAVFDTRGRELWRRALAGAGSATFVGDGSHFAISATGGLVVFATATGDRTAVECGWDFGLHEAVASSPETASPDSVCQDMR